MTTDAIRTRLYNKKLLDYLTVRTNLLDYLVSEFRGLHADAYSSDGVIAALAATVAPSATNNAVDIASALPLAGVSGNGKRFQFDAADTRLQDVLIPPDAGVVYHVGLEQNDVEDGIETNPRTGDYEYTQFTEMLGRVDNPNSVVDNGNGTLTLNVTDLCESGKDYSGRTVRVWLTSRADGGIGPLASSAAVAFQDIAIIYSAPNNTILVPNLLGQTTASTTASDYKVMLNGPTVKRAAHEDLRTTSGCLFLAAVTSVVAASLIVACDTTDQNVISSSLSEMATAIEAQSQAVNIDYGGGGAWADGTTNPATTVEAQLDKVISDLAPSTGTAKIGGAASGFLSAGTLAAQLAQLENDWAHPGRANIFSLVQTFSQYIAADGGVVAGTNQDFVASGTGRYVHGTKTLRIMVNNGGISVIGGAFPSNTSSESFGTGTVAAGTWVIPLGLWDPQWKLSAARIYLPNTIVGAGGLVHVKERNGGGYTTIGTYTFAGGESGLQSLTGITAAEHSFPLVLNMDLTTGSTTTALISFVELDVSVE